MKKIGIYGGTFDPPHFGHVVAVKQAKKLLELDRVLVIPAAHPPHKQTGGDTTPEQRLELTRVAFGKLKYVDVLSLELDRNGPSYTADTLTEVRELYPDGRLYLLTGADMFLSLQTWRNAEEIFASCVVVGIGREQHQTDAMNAHGAFLFERYGANYHVLENPVVPVTSTELRDLLKVGGSSKFLQPEVLAAIKRLGVYTG